MLVFVPKTLEAEIIEIDGKPPPASEAGPAESFKPRRPWVPQFDRRWWPLWILLGVVVLAIGSLVGVLYLGFTLIRSVLRLLFGSANSR